MVSKVAQGRARETACKRTTKGGQQREQQQQYLG